jgi:16S rRNA (adenine1518-N6/adenine1519-N6)-dimethyltransferase
VLTLLTQPWYQVRIVRRLPSSVFYPEPEVDSALVQLEAQPRPFDAATRERYALLVKRAFQQRRKTLGAIFGQDLPKSLDPKKRPAEVSPQEWICAASETSSQLSQSRQAAKKE